MNTTSANNLEEIPLDDYGPNSIEFKILEFYAKHHAFKNESAVFSPKLLRTRSLSQRQGSWTSTESWTMALWSCRNAQSKEKPTNLAKKMSSWRNLFGAADKEEESQSSATEIPAKDPGRVERQGLHTLQWSRSLSTTQQPLEIEAVEPKVASIANRVAEIVSSWPPPEAHTQGGSFTSEGRSVLPALQQPGLSSQPRAASAKKDKEDQANQSIAKIVELLKYSGDQMKREMKEDKALLATLQALLNYSLFKTITDQFLRGIDTRGESEVKVGGFKAALVIDVTAKLTIIDKPFVNKVLGYGTKYLKENFSPGIQRHGGWEKVLGIPQEEAAETSEAV
ncbi:apoptosis facilitator Bcl-2-like protein 14 isoform X2 [Saccopteryx bilineata]|uniref:apoptosis facilitator Bcl-2-like protein 14 isoform X2 n=1 Tax=Saccopteryx bilineata TaxID=59482 RepID=UPI00338FF422